jgi:hypothetical protein
MVNKVLLILSSCTDLGPDQVILHPRKMTQVVDLGRDKLIPLIESGIV